MAETNRDHTEGLSDGEWLATLPEADRERFDRTVRAVEGCMPGADATWMVRVDRAQRHAPLALHMLMAFVRQSGSLNTPGNSLQDMYREAWKILGREHNGEREAALEAIGRMVAAGVTASDLQAFAKMVEAAKIEYVFFEICQGRFDEDIPGWRLMEVGFDGQLTGRPLSLWGVYATDPISGLEGRSVADNQPGEPPPDPS